MADTSPTPPAQEIIETTESRFRQDVLEESLRKLVIVNIWSETQAACKEVKSHLERLIDAAQGKVRLAHLNIASGRSIVDQLGITSAPAVIAFQRGRPVDGFVGALPFDQIKGFLERLLGPIEDNADLLNAAQEMVTQGDIAGAHALLAELTSKEPLDPKAFAILARLYVEAQQIESAKALLERLPNLCIKTPMSPPFLPRSPMPNAQQILGRQTNSSAKSSKIQIIFKPILISRLPLMPRISGTKRRKPSLKSFGATVIGKMMELENSLCSFLRPGVRWTARLFKRAGNSPACSFHKERMRSNELEPSLRNN